MKLKVLFGLCVSLLFTLSSFAAPITLSSHGSSPVISAGNETVAVVWRETDALHAAVVELTGTIVSTSVVPQSVAAARAQIAFDGERYLAVWIDGSGDAGALRAMLIGEDGRFGPLTTIATNARPDIAPVVLWDRTHYVVFWSVKDASAHYAEVNAQGVVLRDLELTDVPAVITATVQSGQVAIVWDSYADSKATINFALLSDGVITTRKALMTMWWFESIMGRNLRDERIAWLNDQYYVSWITNRFGSLVGVAGSRVTRDGTPLDFYSSPDGIVGKRIHYEYRYGVAMNPRMFTIGQQFVLVWQYANQEIGAAIDQNGNVGEPTSLLSITGDVLTSVDVDHTAIDTFAIVYALGTGPVELRFTSRGKRRAAH